MHKIAYGIDNIPIIESIIIGTLVGQIALIFTSIITKGSLYDSVYGDSDGEGTTFHANVVVVVLPLSDALITKSVYVCGIEVKEIVLVAVPTITDEIKLYVLGIIPPLFHKD